MQTFRELGSTIFGGFLAGVTIANRRITAAVGNALLLESGDSILLESGSQILLEG